MKSIDKFLDKHYTRALLTFICVMSFIALFFDKINASVLGMILVTGVLGYITKRGNEVYQERKNNESSN